MKEGEAQIRMVPCLVATGAEVAIEQASEGPVFSAIGAAATLGPDGAPRVMVMLRGADNASSVAFLTPPAFFEFMADMDAAMQACVGQSSPSEHTH
ncbi:MAG: hypothetical protein VYD90_10545 [Pseudomonadota bacterium]|nr:hypothetical protein [Pseudomonadota bacterium]